MIVEDMSALFQVVMVLWEGNYQLAQSEMVAYAHTVHYRRAFCLLEIFAEDK